MKLISYLHDGVTRYGVLTPGGVADMRDCMDAAPATINEFAGLAGTTPGLLAQVAARAAAAPAVPLDTPAALGDLFTDWPSMDPPQ